MTTDLVMYRGDDRSFTVTVSGIDLTAADSIRFTAKRRIGDADADAVITLETPTEIEVTSATTCVVNIPATATADLTRETTLYWDLQVEIGGEVRTLPEPNRRQTTLGTLLIRRDVTRTPA